VQDSSLRQGCWLIWWCGVWARGRVSAGAGLPGLIRPGWVFLFWLVSLAGHGGGGHGALAQNGWLRLGVVLVLVLVFVMVISAPFRARNRGKEELYLVRTGFFGGAAFFLALLARFFFQDSEDTVGDVGEGASGAQVHFTTADVVGDVFQKLVDMGEIFQGPTFETGRQDGLRRTAAGLSTLLTGLGLFFFLAGVVENALGFAGLGIGSTAAAVLADVLAAGFVAEQFFDIHSRASPLDA